MDWNIGLSAWIIQDGNYSDLTVGEATEFAVEFYRKDGTAATIVQSEPSARHLADATYEAVALKVAATEAASVLDLGIRAYREDDPLVSGMPIGARVRTELCLGIDPYPYFEYLFKDTGIPALIYSWRVTSILRQTAPFIEAEVQNGRCKGRKLMVRDASKLAYEEISRTNTWEEDGGHAEYVLRCELLPVPPRRTRTAPHF